MMNKDFITWVRIKKAWTIALIILAATTIIIDRAKGYSMEDTFYLQGVNFILWYMGNYLLDMFQPIPVIPMGRKDNGK